MLDDLDKFVGKSENSPRNFKYSVLALSPNVRLEHMPQPRLAECATPEKASAKQHPMDRTISNVCGSTSCSTRKDFEATENIALGICRSLADLVRDDVGQIHFVIPDELLQLEHVPRHNESG